ncbi:MAG: type I 3-dehydroquinate dehydratase [Betaproteobacteria bacterium]
MKPLKVRGKTLNPHGHAVICTPLVARTADALRAELASILPTCPDVIEWRVDFFEGIHDPAMVIGVARAIRQAAGSIPIIFTRRASHEGGEPIGLAEEAVVALYAAVCASGTIDIIDYELSQSAENREKLRAASRAHDVAMIMSYHNFRSTPVSAELVNKITDAARQGADIAKVAVMPQSPGDVLVLLQATLDASQHVDIPLITMSMGGMGAITRLCGWMYGSALTFAVGKSSSAPGQIPIEDLRAALKTVQRAVSGG